MLSNIIFTKGKRKSSVSCVFLDSSSLIKNSDVLNLKEKTVNKLSVSRYFSVEQIEIMTAPLKVLGIDCAFKIHTFGGGKNSQASSSALSIAKALSKIDLSFKPILRKCKLITTDDRAVESKRYGRLGSRRGQQKSKR